MMITARPHSPLVRSKMRWYFKNPGLKEFTSDLAEKQYAAIREAFETLSPEDYALVKKLVMGTEEFTPDYYDNYIKNHLDAMEVSQDEYDRVLRLIWNMDYAIAVELRFIEDYRTYNRYTRTTGGAT